MDVELTKMFSRLVSLSTIRKGRFSTFDFSAQKRVLQVKIVKSLGLVEWFGVFQPKPL